MSAWRRALFKRRWRLRLLKPHGLLDSYYYYYYYDDDDEDGFAAASSS
jgi:hypothetical protein